MSAESAAPKIAQQASDGAVLAKLLSHMLAVAVLPIAGYFFSLNYMWIGNSTYAAIVAVGLANLVFLSFIMMAYHDHKMEQLANRKPPAYASRLDAYQKKSQ